MAEPRNIVVVGGSTAGLQAAHYTLKHILPALKGKGDAKYHVYLINPSSNWYFRVASPRVAASTQRMAAEKVLFNVNEHFKNYSPEDFTFIEATATSLDTSSRTVTYNSKKNVENNSLSYHALIIATGSNTHYPAFSMSSTTQETLDSLTSTNKKVQTAKDIVIVGGGPTGVEFAGEVAEHLNGKPGWFSKASKNANITLLTSSNTLLPQLRPAIGKSAEQKLSSLNVNVIYNTRVEKVSLEDDKGRSTISLANGDTLQADLYIPAYGVEPNSSWLPSTLLDEKKYLQNNHETLRVDAAGPRVYALGDVASYSRNSVWDIITALPVLVTNMKRDLLAYDAEKPEGKPKGKDRSFKRDEREGMIVPIGTMGGVGALFGYRVPSFFVWLLKGRDYMLGMSGVATASGESVKKEVKWSAEEAVV